MQYSNHIAMNNLEKIKQTESHHKNEIDIQNRALKDMIVKLKKSKEEN